MQTLGIYIENANPDILKNLQRQNWYGFGCKDNWHKLFAEKDFTQLPKLLEEQEFEKKLYNYTDNQISVNAIVGKNGAGKSTLLDIYNRIINNFAYTVKRKCFPNQNINYEIQRIEGLDASLYYELNKEIYCIHLKNKKVYFSNSHIDNLYPQINTLSDFAEHFFYTVAVNYSLYSSMSDWISNLYHKNDGYFTPIVLVPYKDKGIDSEKEKRLADKRVFTQSVFLRIEHSSFIENYEPDSIAYELINYSKYQQIIKNKLNNLKDTIQEYKDYPPYAEIYNNELKIIRTLTSYWNNILKNNATIPQDIVRYCRDYLIYKTLRIIINYESISNQLDFSSDALLKKTLSNMIKTCLWDSKKINYINLKIQTIKQFLEKTYTLLYKDKKRISVQTLLESETFNNISSYDETFINLLPDFYATHLFYKNTSNDKINELSEMSSGEQQLYNSMSYIIYHIKNALSNKNSTYNDKIPYKYFNIIFDEAELYYHPEYQRCFMQNLIKILNRSNLNSSGINITLVTHSPFILSDIPGNNILALENGKYSDKLNKTLGANVYDLLQNQFFMDSTIGECSEMIIEEIINLYSKKESILNQDLVFYEKFVNRLGDEYLSKSLSYIISELKGETFKQRKIKEYENRIKQLRGDS